ncbi:hypothetical protein IW146_000139 [Coemansia sp. RSA 922]|nr:hypothetical protein H4S03_000965 [Coemansia sp. S3946]KAJ2053344.1 hypothetical protein H4S04_000732 [Coemansia sp. S16]KAJ2075953.1 hypothetical protein GGH13_000239 [Coemansia sp. S155-1]KAJ2118168.1 hypothetical protein IW146_000139 [Coemansia sp. RSA 922]
MTEMHNAANACYEQCLEKDQDSILSLARPQDHERLVLAQEIIKEAAQFMESYLDTAPSSSAQSADGMGDTGEPCPDSPMQQSSTLTDLGSSTQRAGDIVYNRTLLKEKLDKVREWILWQSISNEKAMYGPIGAFIEYVALIVQKKLISFADSSSDYGLGRRLVLPSTKFDYISPDTDDTMRIGMGLARANISDPIDDNCRRFSYYEVLAVLEAKRKGNDNGFKDAFKRLYMNAREMYQQQHNLRFAWGVTVSGRLVRVCHFGHDGAISSCHMDVSMPKGRRLFIELLVNWSFCEESQLGRDPTMEYLHDLRCWQIACPSEKGCMGEGADVKYYYFSTVRCQAERVFGRHTRCFLATDIMPTAVISTTNPLIPTVVIKDSWAFSKRNASDDACDEVRSLNKIKEGLSAQAAAKDIIFPKIEAGGRVSFQRNGEWVEDNTDMMYGQGKLVEDNADTTNELSKLAENNADNVNELGKAPSDDGPLFRAHRRIVMSPIGEPLCSTKSVAEFVTVVCDAMRCHSAFVDDCNILHRDISDNNILVVRREGIARGMLIDFDCAIDLEQKERDNLNKVTGTIPYMSINNLSESDIERTSLDDWESMLCLVCWFATRGTISGKRRGDKELAEFPIAEWRHDSTNGMITAKMSAFSSPESFMSTIVNHFKPEGDNGEESDLLKRLAMSIHKCLFRNRRLTPDCHGTFEMQKHVELERCELSIDELEAYELDSLLDESLPRVNPFKERAEKWKEISKQLLAFTNVFWEKAMELQKEANKANSNTAIGNIYQ